MKLVYVELNISSCVSAIVIEVATSLERQMAGDTEAVFIGDDRDREPSCPSGVNGMVRLYYEQ